MVSKLWLTGGFKFVSSPHLFICDHRFTGMRLHVREDVRLICIVSSNPKRLNV